MGTDGGRGRGSRTVLVAVAVASRSCGWARCGRQRVPGAAAANRRQKSVPPAPRTVFGQAIAFASPPQSLSPAPVGLRPLLARVPRPPWPCLAPSCVPDAHTASSSVPQLVACAAIAHLLTCPPRACTQRRSREAAHLSHRVLQHRSIRLDCTVSCHRRNRTPGQITIRSFSQEHLSW